jgi:hypothetical protein
MVADAFELGEHPGCPVRSVSGPVACERFELDAVGEVVGMMSVAAEVLFRIAGRLTEEHDVRRRSHVADFSRGFGHLSLILVAREVRAAGAAVKRAAR